MLFIYKIILIKIILQILKYAINKPSQLGKLKAREHPQFR